MTWNPVVAGKELDLYVLYHEVCKNGGVEAVVRGKRWKRVSFSLSVCASVQKLMSLSAGCACTHAIKAPWLRVSKRLPFLSSMPSPNRIWPGKLRFHSLII